MIMESPVRICLGAALVVHLLLLISTSVSGHALPLETSSTTIKDERSSRFVRTNGTWTTRNKSKLPDVALNELRPKDSASEEHTEKNAKYKDRGRVKFNPLAKTSTESALRRVTMSTEASNIIIVTPTPEVKKPAQIIDSMRTYKKTKMPTVVSSTTPSLPTDTKIESEEDYDDEEEDERSSYDKYTSFDDFFTIPNFNSDDDDFSNKKKNKRGSDKKLKQDYSTPSFGSFSSFFPEDTYNSKDEPYKSESFFDFESELTTPKNDFFDKKFQEISSSILNNLDTIKAKTQPPNMTNVHKIVRENVGLETLSNGIPTNKSTVIIKNTKEIRLVDNDEAGTANKELSDVHGTSIYYEMSVLSTETYNISHTNEDDCDNDTLPSETAPTTPKDELPSLKATLPTIIEIPTSPMVPDAMSDAYSTVSTNILPVSIIPSIFNSISPIPYSTQNTISSTDNGRTKIYSSTFSRSRNYSKRLNLTGSKDSPNSVTIQADQVSINNQGIRPMTRRFHHTTPKIKPIWMAPRKNITRGSYTRSTYPTTIYSEHFNIKDKLSSTMKPRLPTRTVLTTLPSDIDPVLHSDDNGFKKVVHSPSISDNTIPTLWKRGSTKFSTSTVTSSEVETGVSDMEIPPTLAWALASLRSPPSMPSPVANSTSSTQKSVEDNELNNIGEVVDTKATTASPITTTLGIINNEILPKNTTNLEENQPWKPLFVSTSPNSNEVSEPKSSESKSETLPAESNISLQSSPQPASTIDTTKTNSAETTETSSTKEAKPSWVPASVELAETTTEETMESTKVETIPPVDATKSTGFESITKLPAGLTTPKDETAGTYEEKHETVTEKISHTPTKPDYEITTIRFSYVPTEEITEMTETEPTTVWHPVIPTKTKTTTNEDIPITTYRPKYATTTNTIEESTTLVVDTTEQIEVSSQIVENETQKVTVQDHDINETTLTVDTATESLSTLPPPVPTTTEVKESTTIIETTTVNEAPTTTVEAETTEVITPKKEKTIVTTTESTPTQTEPVITESNIPQAHDTDTNSEENSSSNEIIQPTTQVSKATPAPTTKLVTQPETTTVTFTTPMTTAVTEEPTEISAKVVEITTSREEMDTTTDERTTEDDYATDLTTESSSRVLADEAGSGAAVAIAVSTIGVIALVLLVGLLLVVRRRGRRGVYAQRCTPVSLDAYSLDSVSVGQRKGHRLRASKRSYGNPAYDDEVTSHPMNYAALANFALDIESMSAEFAEIPSITVRPDEVPPGCEDKNRYSNVLPLPETRVPLKRIGNDPTSEYINANYVTGPGNIRNYYIMCQAPLGNTVVDFWRMIWEQNSRLIVMLTEYMENGVEKCYEYLPPSEISDNRRTFGDFQIILKKREQRDKYAISSVQLINLATKTWREVTHLWYFWPAKGVPDDYDSVIDFLSEMRSYMKISQNAKEYDKDGVEVIYGDQNRSSFNNLSKLREDNGSGNGVNVYSPAKAEEMMRRGHATNGTLGRMKAASEIEAVRPCTVVCASGAGRAAALVAADVCARALAAGAADVPRAVRDLRAQRPHSLSNRHHYIFVYKVLSEYGNKLMGGGVDTI
ncbi:uncharacterized protein [Epargyreus clarus]|uniref:uncharacterized protein n=1 Tax=Epargyreus clarus TaxID=520877 RepID=UPI003C2BDD98